MENYIDLKLDFKPFHEKFKVPVPQTNDIHISVFYDMGIFSNECRQWLKEVGLTPIYAGIFQKPPLHRTMLPHIDGIGDGLAARTFGVNWNFDGDGALMSWYKTSAPGVERDGPGYPPHLEFSPDEVEEIESSRSVGPLLFKTTVPHSVINTSDTNWARSVTIGFSEKPKWEVLPTMFAKWLR